MLIILLKEKSTKHKLKITLIKKKIYFCSLLMDNKIDEEIEELKKDIKRLGKPNAEGKYAVQFGVLFDDEKT